MPSTEEDSKEDRNKTLIRSFIQEIFDWRANIEHIVAENNLVMIFLNGNGTHKGDFRGTPPTNKQ
jgi:predicted ester cyclase